MNETDKPITEMLQQVKQGDARAISQLLPIVYNELRRLAKIYLNRERANHTLQPTALVHEAYLRLIGQKPVEWQNRAHFFGVSARLMREILIEHARAKKRIKRGGEFATIIALDDAVSFRAEKQFDALALDEALSRLEKLDERQGRIVEMKFFGGLSIEEIAEVMGVSQATVKREWSSAKLLLYKMLSD